MINLNEFELNILDFIRENIACPILDTIVPIITKLGDGGIFWIITAVVMIIFKNTRKTGLTVGIALLLGFIIGNLILKNAIGRIRPYDLCPNIKLLVPALSDFSFPSGHTLASFEAATVLLIRDKRFGIPAIILASLIALSRLYLYVHYPTDVLAGIILGVTIAILSCKFTDRLYSKFKHKSLRDT